MHHGKRVNVKHLGAPASPFEFARQHFQKVSTYNLLVAYKQNY